MKVILSPCTSNEVRHLAKQTNNGAKLPKRNGVKLKCKKKGIEDAINNMKAKLYAEMKAEKGDSFKFDEYEQRVKEETHKILNHGKL